MSLGTTASALYAQNSEHFLQKSHLFLSIFGISTNTSLLSFILTFKKIFEFGSSTSQSISCTSFRLNAIFVAIVVLPVPPLPLAIDIFRKSPYIRILKINYNFLIDAFFHL